MSYQGIAAEISPADVLAVKDSFAALLENLPFFVNLTANERKPLLKKGPGSLSFTLDASPAPQVIGTILFHIRGSECQDTRQNLDD